MHLNIDQFELTNSHDHKKNFYIHKDTGVKYMISNFFDDEAFAHYLAGGLYKLMLGELVPNIYLIKFDETRYGVGSEFIPNFRSIFNVLSEELPQSIVRDYLRKNFPNNCNELRIQSIDGFEKVLAALIIMGESDAQDFNIGIVPKVGADREYVVAKIDHDRSFCELSLSKTSLSAMAKVVYDKGSFNFKNVNLDKLSEAFMAIYALDDSQWNESINSRIDFLLKNKIFVPQDIKRQKEIERQKEFNNLIGEEFHKIKEMPAPTLTSVLPKVLIFNGYDVF